MKEKANSQSVQEKANSLGSLARSIESVTEAFSSHLNKEVILLKKAEIKRLQEIESLFSEFKIANFTSASEDQQITQQVKTILSDLLDGEVELGQVRQALNTLKQQDEQNIKVVNWYTIVPGVVGLVGMLASLLILLLVPAFWIFVIITGFITLGSLGIAANSLKLDIDSKKESLECAWDGKLVSERHGITELLNTLIQDDIELLKKVNSVEWRNDFATAYAEIQEIVKQKRENVNNKTASYSSPSSFVGQPLVEEVHIDQRENTGDLKNNI